MIRSFPRIEDTSSVLDKDTALTLATPQHWNQLDEDIDEELESNHRAEF